MGSVLFFCVFESVVEDVVDGYDFVVVCGNCGGEFFVEEMNECVVGVCEIVFGCVVVCFLGFGN